MTSKTFNVGVIGYGLSAKIFHIPFIQSTPSLTLHSIVQRSPSPSNSAPLDHPSLTHLSTAQSLLSNPSIDVVVITTPPDSHYDLAKAALEAGKHVLVEKPLVATSAQARDLATLARKHARLLCVYQNRRFDADFVLARRLVNDGTLGRVLALHTHFDRLRAVPAKGGAVRAEWKGRLPRAAGGGPLHDLGVHLIDQAYVLFGMPVSVRGRLLCQADDDNSNDDDNKDDTPNAVAAELVYPNHLVTVAISPLSVESVQPRFWIRGSKGSFRSLGLDPQEDQLKAGMRLTDAAFGVPPKDSISLVVLDANRTPVRVDVDDVDVPTYSAFYAAFARALETGREEDLPATADEAADVLTVMEAIVESHGTKRDVDL